jgi:hypothetical protein
MRVRCGTVEQTDTHTQTIDRRIGTGDGWMSVVVCAHWFVDVECGRDSSGQVRRRIRLEEGIQTVLCQLFDETRRDEMMCCQCLHDMTVK